jgi:hypothetical protein
MLFNFVLEYGIGRVQVHQDRLKLNSRQWFLAYADGVNILCKHIYYKKQKFYLLVVMTLVHK